MVGKGSALPSRGRTRFDTFAAKGRAESYPHPFFRDWRVPRRQATKSTLARLDVTFSALADPIRRGIVDRLAGGQAFVSELAKPFNVSLPAVSKHLRVLERAGLIVREREGRFQRCRLVALPMRDAAMWMASYRSLWEQQFDALAEYLRKSKKKGKS